MLKAELEIVPEFTAPYIEPPRVSMGCNGNKYYKISIILYVTNNKNGIIYFSLSEVLWTSVFSKVIVRMVKLISHLSLCHSQVNRRENSHPFSRAWLLN